MFVTELLAQFGSLAEEHGTLTAAVLTIVEPGASPRFACTTSLKLPLAFRASDEMVHVIVPVPPTAGRVPQFHADGKFSETNVEPVGMVSV